MTWIAYLLFALLLTVSAAPVVTSLSSASFGAWEIAIVKTRSTYGVLLAVSTCLICFHAYSGEKEPFQFVGECKISGGLGLTGNTYFPELAIYQDTKANLFVPTKEPIVIDSTSLGPEKWEKGGFRIHLKDAEMFFGDDFHEFLIPNGVSRYQIKWGAWQYFCTNVQ